MRAMVAQVEAKGGVAALGQVLGQDQVVGGMAASFPPMQNLHETAVDAGHAAGIVVAEKAHRSPRIDAGVIFAGIDQHGAFIGRDVDALGADHGQHGLGGGRTYERTGLEWSAQCASVFDHGAIVYSIQFAVINFTLLQ